MQPRASRSISPVFCTFAALLLGAHAVAAEIKISGLSLPFFDESQRLVRRFTAAQARPADGSLLVRDGKVTFFSTRPETIGDAIGTLDFAQARYVEKREQIAGDEQIRLQTNGGTLSGHGFTYDLATNVLTLESAVRGEFKNTQMHATRGQFRLQPDGKSATDVVAEGRLEGAVTVSGPLLTARNVDRAESPSARYVASAQKIFLSSPVTVWRNGQSHELALDVFEIDLSEPEKP